MEKRKCGTNIKTKMCISQWYVYTKYLCLVYNWDAPNVKSIVKRGSFTIQDTLIIKKIGTLTIEDSQKLEESLKLWLGFQ
jgi:hypothetical protein